MYGKILYDPNADIFICEFPIKNSNGSMRICGKSCKDLVRHVTRHHKISAREYKKMLGIDLNESLLSRRTTQSLAEKIIARKGYLHILPYAEKYKLKKGENRIQCYKRSEQNKARLRTLRKNNP
jgi:hypothetical protein